MTIAMQFDINNNLPTVLRALIVYQEQLQWESEQYPDNKPAYPSDAPIIEQVLVNMYQKIEEGLIQLEGA